MAQYKFKDKVTGETFYFDWQGKKAPTQDDYARVAQQQRESRVAAFEKMKANEPTFLEKTLMGEGPVGKAFEYGRRALGTVVPSEPWNPGAALVEAGRGAAQMVTGTPSEPGQQYPRVAGAVRAGRGVLGAVSVPLTAAGIAAAPVATLAGVGVAGAAGGKIREAADVIAPNAPPEIKDLASDIATLAVGAGVGGGIHRLTRPPKPSTTLTRVPPPYKPPPRTGVNWSEVVPPEELPPGPNIRPAPPVVRPAIPATAERVPVGRPMPTPAERPPVPAQIEGRAPLQLPARGEPIPMEPAPIRMPEAGTYERGLVTERAFAPQGPPLLAERTITPGMAGELPESLPPAVPPRQAIMRARGPAFPTPPVTPPGPSPISPMEVGVLDSAKAAAPAPIPEETPPTPPPTPIPAPTVPAPAPAPAPTPMDIARTAMEKARVAPPTTPVTPPPATPAIAPQEAPIPPALPLKPIAKAPEIAPVKAPEAPRGYKKPEPPMGPTTTPKPRAKYPEVFYDDIRDNGFDPDKMTPEIMAKAFEAWKQDIKEQIETQGIEAEAEITKPKAPPKTVEPTVIPREPVVPQDARQQILDFVKLRRTGNIGQIQERLGLGADVIKPILADLKKRGLIEATGPTWKYRAMSGEPVGAAAEPVGKGIGPVRPVIKPPITEVPNVPPPTAAALPPREVTLPSVETPRTIAQKAIEAARAKTEEGQPRPFEQKRTTRLAELEAAAKTATPGAEKAAADKALAAAKKTYGDRVDNMRTLHEEAARHGMKHEDLSKMLKERFGVESMKELKPEQMSEVEDELITKRVSENKDINRRIDALEELEDLGQLGPDQQRELKSLYKQLGFWKSERGTSRVGARARDMQTFLHKFKGMFSSTDRFLEEIPEAKPITNLLHKATTEGDTWEGSILRKLADARAPTDRAGILRDAWNFAVDQGVELPRAGRSASIEDMLDLSRPVRPYEDINELAEKIGPEREILHRLKVNMFERPAASEARSWVDDIPDRYDKDMARWYIDNWSRTDLQNAGKRWLRVMDRKAAAIGARSVLFGSTRLQVLHLARFVMQVWPEMGEVNSFKGLARFMSHPDQTWTMIRDYGLLPQSRVPWKLKTGMERFDYAGNYADLGNSLVKAVAFEANMAKFKGDIAKAVRETKRVEGVVGRETPIRFLEEMPRNIFQFKYWLAKYLGNVASAAEKKEMAKLGRYLAAFFMLEEATRRSGVALWHMKTENILKPGGAFLSTLQRTMKSASEGKMEKAGKEFVTGMTPGGVSLGPAIGKMIQGDTKGALHAIGPFEREPKK